MKKTIICTLVAASLSAASLSVMAADAATVINSIDYYGYFRAGVGQGADGSLANTIGGDSYEKNKIGRLGNEFDVYGEIGFGKEIYNEGGKSVYLQTMFNYWDGDTNSANDDNPFGWENLNMQLKNFMGLNETSWAGIRQYKPSYYIDATDYYYWSTTTTGAGIEDMKLGQGNLSIDVLHKDLEGPVQLHHEDGTSELEEGTTINAISFGVMYDNLPLWDGATLALGYKFLNADPSDQQIDDVTTGEHDYEDGHAFMAELNQTVLESGSNRTVLQYYIDSSALQGVDFGPADALNGEVKSGSGWAIRNFGSIPLSANWDLGHAINYAAADSVELWGGDDMDASVFAINANVAYHWSDITRTYFDAGYFDEERTINGEDFDRSGAKYTIAQGWSFARGEPELRLYATYFDSNNTDWDNSLAFEGNQSDDTWVVGVQANVWW